MPTRLPPLNALRAFEAAARHLSFSKAAKELHVTPGAISRQIRVLEDFLGVALFHRLSRAVELTEAAQACLPKVREGFDSLREAIELIRVADAKVVVSLAVAPAFAAKWLVPRLHRFTEAHPGIELRLSANRALIDALRHDGTESAAGAGFDPADADLTIRFGTGQYPGARADRLCDVNVTPIFSPVLLDRESPLRTPEDLRFHTLLHEDTVYFTGDEADWAVWLRAAGVDGVDASRGPRFNHAGLALDAAVQGLGVVLGTPFLAASDLAAGRLVAPFALRLPASYSYYLVTPEAIADQPNAAVFRAWLLEEIGRGDDSPE